MTDKEILTIIKAAMIMLNTYMDLMGSAELLELASLNSSREKVEDLVLELADANIGSSKDIIECKAEMVLSRMRSFRGIREVN